MKLSVTMISFGDIAGAGKMSVEEFIDVSARYGVDAVDILEYYWRDKEKEIRSVPKLLKEKGLELGAFCIGNNFVVPAEERPGMVDYVKQGINTAARLGAERLRIFGGSADIPAELINSRLDIVVENICKCIDDAKANGITLILENHGGVPLTSDEMMEIIVRVNSPYLKLNFDLGNFLSYVDENPLKAAEKTISHVGFIHAKDLIKIDGPQRYQACVTGEGVVPVKECLKFFKQKGYGGYVSLEYEAWESVGSMQGVKLSLEYLKKILKEI